MFITGLFIGFIVGAVVGIFMLSIVSMNKITDD